MNYTDLLERQEKEREQLHVSSHNGLKKLIELQNNSPMPERFEPEKQNLHVRYQALEKAMNQRHTQERQLFIPEKGQPKGSKQPEKDMTDAAAEMLARYRQRQKERQERGYERDSHEP